MLVRGPRRFRERLLSLERWQHATGCLVKEGSYKEAWVRVLGLPLHLWGREVFIKIGGCCGGGFVAVDEGSVNLVQLQWARILVRLNGRSLPASLQLVVGFTCYSIQLWWEVPPKFSMVVPRSCSNGSLESKVRGDDGGGSRIGVEKDLVLLQAGRGDVSNSGGKSNRFGEGLDCYVQKVVADGEDFGGSGRRSPVGRRACLEDTGDSERTSGLVREGSVELQKDQGVTGLAVEDRGGLGQAKLSGPSLLTEEGSLGMDRPLGLLAGDDRAVVTVPLEWFKSTLTWISGTNEALQAEATRYSSQVLLTQNQRKKKKKTTHKCAQKITQINK